MRSSRSAILAALIALTALLGANTAIAQEATDRAAQGSSQEADQQASQEADQQASQDSAARLESQAEQAPNQLYQRFRLEAGAFASFFNTNVRLGSERLGVGTEIDLEDDLGFDARKFDFRGSGYYRLGRRHRLSFGYVNLSRSSNAVLDEEIEFGDEVFPVDAEVESEFRTQFALLGYAFSFLAREKIEVGFGIGLSAMFTKAGIAAVGSVGDEPIDAVEERTDATFPVATLGFGVNWAPLSRLIVSGDVGGLYVSISTIKAAVGDAKVGAEYFLTRGFGLGARFAFTKLGVEETEDPQLKVTYRYSGLQVYGVFALF